MAELVVIVPSRGRPEAARELMQTFKDTCTAETQLVIVIDDDDPRADEYPYGRSMRPNTSMVEALNVACWEMQFHDNEKVVGEHARLRKSAAAEFNWPRRPTWPWAAERGAFAVGFMGDDHRPRTKGWDQLYLDALRELGTGIVYGNDLLQGERLATQVAMTTDIVRALGFMAPPVLRHMYVDNYWIDLGRMAGCLRYLPDVVVEHMHPLAGKAEWTEGHIRVNAEASYSADRIAYMRYRAEQGLSRDVAKVKALRG